MSIQLKNIFVCENVIVSFNGQPSLINLIAEITSSAFPAMHPKLSILVSVSGENGIYDEEVEIVPIDDDTKTIAKVTGKAEIKDKGTSNFIGNFINTVFPKEGKYWIKVTFKKDGKEEIVTKRDKDYIELKKI